MATLFDDTVIAAGQEATTFTAWTAVGTATAVAVDVVGVNYEAPDIWIEWTNDVNGPEPEPLDLLNQLIPIGNHYHLRTADVPPQGTHIRLKAIAYADDAVFHATITTA